MAVIRDMLSDAWQAVARHRLRSVLATLGVAVGVCALTSIVSVEDSWRRTVEEFFAPMDLQTVKVSLAGDNWRERGLARADLRRDDAEAIVRTCSAVKSVTAMTMGVARAETRDSVLEVAVRAVDADFTRTLPDTIREGRVFTADEAAQRTSVCVVSLEARMWLFGDEPCTGEGVRLNGRRFTVVGVISGDRHTGISPRTIYIPFGCARSLTSTNQPYQPQMEIFALARDPKAATVQIEQLMRRRIGGDGTRPYTASLWRTRDAALRARMRVTLYSGLAGICALLAAGIGIAALLFVSVAERSQEIGVRRAIGAARTRIYAEYVVAAGIMSATGAAVGAMAGVPAAAAGAFASRWKPVLNTSGGLLLPEGAELPRISDIALMVSWPALALAVGLALITGIVAALAPASEAAAVEPALAIARRAGTRSRVRKALTCLQVGFGVLVLVVLTSYYSFLEGEERTEARNLLGQDRVFAAADPIAALRKPFGPRYLEQCREALASVVTSPEKLADLRRQTPLLQSLTPELPLWMAVQRGDRTLKQSRAIFTTAEAFDYKPALAADDRRRVVQAFRASEPVAVITPDARDQLFGATDPAGRQITVGGRKFTVVAIRGSEQDIISVAEAMVPIAFYPLLKHRASTGVGLGFLTEARVHARPIDARRYPEATAQLRDALLPLLPRDFRRTIKMSEQVPETTKQFIFQGRAVAIRGAVGALAVLLVALIGLANMLLVSVHEGMRETGLRRALGAQRSDVFLQFVAEGIFLSALGAVMGLALGAGICGAARTWASLPITFSAFWGIAGAVATVLTGATVSLPPGVIAAQMQPVEALRYE